MSMSTSEADIFAVLHAPRGIDPLADILSRIAAVEAYNEMRAASDEARRPSRLIALEKQTLALARVVGATRGRLVVRRR